MSDQIWDLFDDKHIFYGKDPKERRYVTRAHLARDDRFDGTSSTRTPKEGEEDCRVSRRGW